MLAIVIIIMSLLLTVIVINGTGSYNSVNSTKLQAEITQIEILIDYLDKNKLQELYDFCIKMTNDENIASMNNIKKLVKNKMNN